MLAYFDLSIGWRELARRTYRELLDDDALGLAAQLAYYFFLSLFPALICLLAFASFFPVENLTDEAARLLAPVAPVTIVDIIREQMLNIASGDNEGLLSLGLLGAIWSSSAAMVAIIGAMNRAYDIEEARAWWKVRLTAIFLTVGLAIFILVSFTLVVAGPEIAEALARRFGLGEAFVWTWHIVQWPAAFVLVACGIALVYYFAPDADQDWVWITPGSVVATFLWLLASLGFRAYVVNFGDYEATYGTLGGIMLLLLWFYLSGLAIVVGAEINSEIEHASPWGKEPGEKVPGQRRSIGPAAARAFYHRPLQPAARQGEHADVERARAQRPASARLSALQTSLLERIAAYVMVFVRWRNRIRR